MEEKILRGIQRCPVTAVHHISWLRCPFCLNQIAYCHSCAFLLLSDALPPHVFPTSNIIPLCCPAPLLQKRSCFQVFSTVVAWVPTKHSFTDTVSHTSMVHLWWMGPFHGIWDFILLPDGGHGKHGVTDTGMLHWAFWLVFGLLSSCNTKKMDFSEKQLLHLHRSIYTRSPSQPVADDFTVKAPRSWDTTMRTVSWSSYGLLGRLRQELLTCSCSIWSTLYPPFNLSCILSIINTLSLSTL